MTHTPPPWRIHTFTPKGWTTETTTILGPDDVAIVGGVHWGSADGSVGQANARLICAAPDLLEALRLAAVWANPDTLGVPTEAEYAIVLAAIAKAEGRE